MDYFLVWKTMTTALNGIFFRTRQGNQYFYDDQTGLVFFCPDEFAENLRQGRLETQGNSRSVIGDNRKAEYTEYAGELFFDLYRDWQNRFGAFKSKSTVVENQRRGVDISKIKNYLGRYGYTQLILNITERCNLRCKYCIFSDAYPYYRNINNNRMDFDVAKKAVDYYFSIIKENMERNALRKPTINFYGGEPLLEFNLIKQVVEYVRSIYRGDVLFSTTTNGTLLNNERIDFLIKHNFGLFISLDGPEAEHDRQRVDELGKGTFKIIIKNIKRIKNIYPHYTNCLILSTYDYGTDLKRVIRYFDEHRNALPVIGRVNMVSMHATNHYDQYNEKVRKQFSRKLTELKNDYISQMKVASEQQYSDYLEKLIGVEYRLIMIRETIRLRDNAIIRYSGACVPGTKMSISCDGKIHICEKINEHFSIGDIYRGLDFDRIEEIIRKYDASCLQGCSECSITRLCSSCFVNFAQNGEFRKSDSFCQLVNKNVSNLLAETYSLLEENPRIFSRLLKDYHNVIDCEST